MSTIRFFKNKDWSIKFGHDECYKLGSLQKGELEYNKSICKLSEENYNDYINQKIKNTETINVSKKSIILLNGEIRNAEKFIKWANQIKNYSYLYFYTDKSSYFKIDKIHRDNLEKISSGFCFSEDDNYYQENIKRDLFESRMHQWLKLKQSLLKWKNEWEIIGARTVIRMRSDISFLNPYLLEYQIKRSLKGIVSKGTIALRSDLIFAFDINDSQLLADFYESIFSFYLSEDWINYPYIPLNPDLIIKARGSMRIEWNNFPTKYIGISPSKNKYFERVACFYSEMQSDFNKYSSLKNHDIKKKVSLFGNLSSVRKQPHKIFASERCFAHYLISKGIIPSSHNQMFSGQIIRGRNNKIKFLKNFF